MAIWLKKCSALGQTANGYMVELQAITDEVCQWLDKFEEEAVAYLSSSATLADGKLLAPKTPIQQKRLRKRRLKAAYTEDDENSPLPCKSSCVPSSTSLLNPQTPLKKVYVCLTRIDDAGSNNLASPQKTHTPVKPPRRLKLECESSQDVQSASDSSKTDFRKSLTVAVKEVMSNPPDIKKTISMPVNPKDPSKTDFAKSLTVPLKEVMSNTPDIKETISMPLSLKKADQQQKRGSLLNTQGNQRRLSISRSRSSIARLKARQSIRRSKRLSEKDQRVTATTAASDDENDASFITEEIAEAVEDEMVAKGKKSLVEFEAIKCADDLPVQPAVSTKKEASPEHGSSFMSTMIPVAVKIDETSCNGLNTTQTIFKKNVSGKVNKCSMGDKHSNNDIESDVDSVISKTPSPVCPASKVVRPKVIHKPQSSAIHTAIKTPIAKVSMSVGLEGRNKTLRPKPNIGGHRTKIKARNSSLTSNTSYMSQLSPKPMTPQQKQEKCLETIYLREQKSKEVLRQRDATRKKAIEEKKRKLAEKVMKAKMQKEKIEEARLTKIREEEERMMHRKKLQEEAEKRRIAQERQAEKEQELQRRKELEEGERLKREAEQKRIAKEKETKTQKLLNSTITIEKPALNSTAILDDPCNESNNYNMTPQPNYPLPNRNIDNYDIDNLNEGDSTDDDEQPRQVIPRWAQGHEFKKAILQQLHTKINTEVIFPPEELMLVPNLTEIFRARKKKYDKRTSSAVWSSPIWKAP